MAYTCQVCGVTESVTTVHVCGECPREAADLERKNQDLRRQLDYNYGRRCAAEGVIEAYEAVFAKSGRVTGKTRLAKAYGCLQEYRESGPATERPGDEKKYKRVLEEIRDMLTIDEVTFSMVMVLLTDVVAKVDKALEDRFVRPTCKLCSECNKRTTYGHCRACGEFICRDCEGTHESHCVVPSETGKKIDD